MNANIKGIPAAAKGCLFWLMLLIGLSQGQTQWEKYRTPDTAKDIKSVVYGKNLFVAVGDTGVIYTSADGKAWKKRSSGTTADLRSVSYGKNTYVAVGDSNTVLASSDGVKWTARKTELSGIPYFDLTTLPYSMVSYGNSRFIVPLPFLNSVLTSTDGKTWAQKEISSTTLDIGCFGLTFENKQFIMSSMGGLIYVSPDGTSWTAHPVVSPASGDTVSDVFSVAYGNKRYVAASLMQGTAASSTDLTKWTVSSADFNAKDILYQNGVFVAVGVMGRIFTSGDGSSWTSRTDLFDVSNPTLSSVAYGNNRFVAVGSKGSVRVSKATTRIVRNGSRQAAPAEMKVTVANQVIKAQPSFMRRNEAVNVALFNAAGKRVYASRVRMTQGGITIPVNDLSAGTYLLSIEGSRNGGHARVSLTGGRN